MTAPLTGMETNGNWTSLEHEEAFLTQLAADTPAILSEAGRTVQDRPIWRLDLGEGVDNTILFVGLQHPREPSGREAVLAMVRDLAYATDRATRSYLEKNRVVFVPNVNADGAFVERTNVNGVNLNRDHFKLSQPESRAVAAVIRDTDPTLIYDLHENGLLPVGEWAGTPELVGGSFSKLSALGESIYNRIIFSVQAGGYTAGRYYRSSTPVGSLSSAAGSHHAVGLVHEPTNKPGRSTRTEISRLGVEAARQWHAKNSLVLQGAKVESIEYARTTTDPISLTTTEMADSAPIVLDVAGYRLQEPLPDYLVDLHGIEVQGDFVSVNQPARLAVPMLCDPESRDRVVQATRVARVRPQEEHTLPRGRLVDAYLMVGEERVHVHRVRYHDGVKERNVTLSNA